MSYQPIENYGIIGNMRTVALIGMNGSIRPAFSGRSWTTKRGAGSKFLPMLTACGTNSFIGLLPTS